MPELVPVDHDPFGFTPVDHDPFAVNPDATLAASMTHWPEAPNPAAPYVEAIKNRFKPIDLTPVHLPGTQPKDYLSELAQNPAILAQNIDQAMNFNFGGMARGPAGAIPDWLKEESLNQPGVKVRNYPSGAVRVDEGTPQTGIRPTGKVGVIRANPDDMADFRRMIAEGRSFSEIGEYLGISKGAVAGIKRREELKSGAERAAQNNISPAALVVARRMPDGTIRYGKPGDVHSDLMTRKELNDDGPTPQSIVDSMGFAKPGGAFLSKTEALEFAKRNEPQRAAHSLEQPEYGLEAATYNEATPARALRFQPVDHDPFSTDPLERQAITRGRSGRPIQTAPLPIGNENAVLEAGAKLNEPPPSITAFHGSPHDFDKFDLSKIGTGEGAQAYGSGLYFAENEGVAKEYRKNLTPQAYMVKEDDGTFSVENYSEARNPTFRDLKRLRGFRTEEDARKAVDERNANLGRMYQVSINADPAHFLDWDKPLSEQHPKVQEALKSIQHPVTQAWQTNGAWPHVRAQNFYDAIGGDRTNAAVASGKTRGASEQLRAAGIPGIKYLDQGSRFQPQQVEHLNNHISGLEDMLAKTPKDDPRYGGIQNALAGRRNELAQMQPTRNFVVFDDKLIDIMKKYGLAGLSALPAAGAYHFRTQQVDHDPFAQQ